MDNKVFVFNYHISLVSPNRLTGESEIKKILGVKEIPKNMRALLAQAVFPPSLLKPLNKLKKQAWDFMGKHSTRNELLGWLIPPDAKEFVMDEFKKFHDEFMREKARFLAAYQEACEEHLEALRAECEGFGNIDCNAFIAAIRREQPSMKYLEEQIDFVMLNPRAVELDPEEMGKVAQGAFGRVLREIAARANDAAGAKRYSTMVKAAGEIREKLDGLSYLDPRMGTIAAEIDSVVKQLPPGDTPKDSPSVPPAVAAMIGVFAKLSRSEQVLEALESGEPLFPAISVKGTPVTQPVKDLFTEDITEGGDEEPDSGDGPVFQEPEPVFEKPSSSEEDFSEEEDEFEKSQAVAW